MRELLEALEYDFTEDIMMEWDAYIEDGYTVQEVTSHILEQYGNILEEDEHIVLYVTLALLQIEHDELDINIREEVLDIIGTQKLEQEVGNNKRIQKLIQFLKKSCK